MALSRAVTRPDPIAGRIPINTRRAGRMALLPCGLLGGPGCGRRRLEPQGHEKRERGQVSPVKAVGEKRATAHERVPDRSHRDWLGHMRVEVLTEG